MAGGAGTAAGGASLGSKFGSFMSSSGGKAAWNVAKKLEEKQANLAAAIAFSKQMDADARFLKSVGAISKETALMEGRRVTGGIRTAYAKTGLALTGTYLEVIGGAAFESMFGALTVEAQYRNAARRKKMAAKAAKAKAISGMFTP